MSAHGDDDENFTPNWDAGDEEARRPRRLARGGVSGRREQNRKVKIEAGIQEPGAWAKAKETGERYRHPPAWSELGSTEGIRPVSRGKSQPDAQNKRGRV